MTERSPARPRLLLSGYSLDTLKLVAALAMLIDHANHILWDGKSALAYLIGRMAFPLFAFAAATAILRTDGAAQRLYRQSALLLLCALISELISRLTRDYHVLNVLFTLALATAIAPTLMRCSAWQRALIYAAGLAAMAMPGWWEFSWSGLLLPGSLALALSGKRGDACAAFILAASLNFSHYATPEGLPPAFVIALIASASTVLPLGVIYGVQAFFAQTSSGTLNTQRLLPHYALHAFYPAHMLALWLIKIL